MRGKEIICIVCPKGCRLSIDERTLKVTGNDCPRGESYGKIELTNPTRVITSTVRITGALHRRCPVKTSGAIPKGLIKEAMRLLDEVLLSAPVAAGQPVLKNILDTGLDFVTTRSMKGDER